MTQNNEEKKDLTLNVDSVMMYLKMVHSLTTSYKFLQ